MSDEGHWEIPQINGNGIRVPLDQLKDIAHAEEEDRSLPRWQFPILDCGGDFITDPALTQVEADAVGERHS